MKIKRIIISIALLSLSLTSVSYAHSGRTDSSGGHNCSAASVKKDYVLDTITIMVEAVVHQAETQAVQKLPHQFQHHLKKSYLLNK
ncbi:MULTISPECIES: hypothetical protein [unclassified Paenibacillus]|uniref:hypothetical protein n=1 Tax=unclassified Paenibacillus TaxID=185978 RepID=UPI00362929DE